MDSHFYLKLSSRYRATYTGCPSSFCVSLPTTIPNIFPSANSALPIRDISLEVIEVALTGLQNIPAGVLFVFNKTTTATHWTKHTFPFDSCYCPTVTSLVTHLNSVFPDWFKMKFVYDPSEKRVKYEFSLHFMEKAVLDCSFLMLPATIAAKLGFSVPSLKSESPSFARLPLYPESYAVNEIPVVCDFGRCPDSNPICDVTVSVEFVNSAASDALVSAVQLEVMQKIVDDQEDYAFNAQARFEPNLGSCMNIIEVSFQQQNLAPTPSFLQPPNYERLKNEAVVSRLNMSHLNLSNIKPNDLIILKPDPPNAILCNLKSNRVLIKLKDVTGFSVPFDPAGETELLIRISPGL